MVETRKVGADPIGSPAAPSVEYKNFFHSSYRNLYIIALFAGATHQEAEDAISAVMEELLRRWHEIKNPHAYARRAVISNLAKEKTRLRRLQHRLEERGYATPEIDVDPSLTAWEDRQWVQEVLNDLPKAQREVMELIVEGHRPHEIAGLLGKSKDNIRKNLQHALKTLRLRDGIAQRQAARSLREED